MYRLSVRTPLCAVIAVWMMALAGCSSSPTKQEEAAPTKTATTAKTVSKAAASKGATTAPVVDAPVEPPPIPPEATERFEKALSLMSSGDLLRAESEFQRLSASYPDYSGPWANLGVIYLKNGRLADAEKALLSATKLSPQNAAAFNQLGIVYRNLGRFKEADVAYTSALAADSHYALAYVNLGVLYDLYLQQPKRALEAFEHYQGLVGAPDQKVDAWVKELRGRLGIKSPPAEAKPAESSSTDSKSGADQAKPAADDTKAAAIATRSE